MVKVKGSMSLYIPAQSINLRSHAGKVLVKI